MKFLSQEKLSRHKYKTPEGYLVCVDAILGRTGKQQYYKHELFGDSVEGANDIVDVDRPEKEVFDSNTLASFENKPVTVEHPDENVTVNNYKDYSVGFVRDVRRVDDNIVGNLVITDKQTIEEIENGEHTDLSCGYDCEIIDDGKGEYMQSKIRGNHVALCQEGRAGNARIIDSKVKDDTAIAKIVDDSRPTSVSIRLANKRLSDKQLIVYNELYRTDCFDYSEKKFIKFAETCRSKGISFKDFTIAMDEYVCPNVSYYWAEKAYGLKNDSIDDNMSIKDSDKLSAKIKSLTDYINNINVSTKGKIERYHIEDEIISIKRLLKDEFNNIDKSKHVESDKVSMQASIRQMTGYFGELINAFKNMSTKVKDLTLSQFLKQQSYRLNTWKQTEFNVLDSKIVKDYGLENIKIPGYRGTWYEIDKEVVKGKTYMLLEHEEYGDEAAHLFVEKVGSSFKVLDDESYDMSIDQLIRECVHDSIKDWSGSRENGVIYEHKDGYYYITHKNGHVEKVPESRFKNIDDLYYYLDSIKDSKTIKNTDNIVNVIKVVNAIKKAK